MPLTITWSGCPSPVARSGCAGEVALDELHVGAREIVDGDRVGTSERAEVDRLHVVHVHRDVRHVAEEAQPLAVRGHVDALAGVGAVEEHRVEAGLALDRVAAVARIPRERVVAGTEEREVVAPVAVGRVVAVAAEECLDAPAAGERVVSCAAVEGQSDCPSCECGGRNGIVAAEAVDLELVGRLLC